MPIHNIQELNYEYYHQPGGREAYLLLHGRGDGIRESYTQELMGKLAARDTSVFAFDFPYLARGDKSTSGVALTEESQALQVAFDFLKDEQHIGRIHIIAKSLGGIVASHWFAESKGIEGVKVSIMGYVLGEDGVVTDALRNKLAVVVQGGHDRYGNADAVRSELLAHQVGGKVVGIPGADHSYRDPTAPSRQPPAY